MPDWVPLGDRAIRFARPADVAAPALVDAIKQWPHVVDVVIARDDVGVYYDRAPAPDGERIAALATLTTAPAPRGRLVTLRVIYDGEDLLEVARRAALPASEVVEIHAAVTYEVESIGFAPGFAYLVGVDARLHLPRRASPRPRVPAGSVAIAGGYTAVYPFVSPGGWHLIGHVVDGPMFDARGPRVRLGDHVRFEPERR